MWQDMSRAEKPLRAKMFASKRFFYQKFALKKPLQSFFYTGIIAVFTHPIAYHI